MGYHLTILRTRAGRQVQITLDEIEAAIAGLPDWSLAKDRKALRYSAADGFRFRLSYSADDGELWQKADEVLTSDRAMDLMVDLAARLSARLRGDEFETYRSAQESYTHPDDVAEINALQKQAIGRRRQPRAWDIFRLIVLAVLVCFFAWKVVTGQ